MKIIQSFNTFEGYKMGGGFATPRSLTNFLTKSYEYHKFYDYCLYTDKYGYEIIKKIINKNHIKIIDFDEIDDRNQFIGKFQVQELQTEPYIHVDLDAILYKLPNTQCDIITEKKRDVISFGRELNALNIDAPNGKIICSGIIGFNNIEFKNDYIEEVYKKIDLIKNDHNYSYKYAWCIEEVLLTNLANISNLSVYELQQESYIHKHGNINKKLTQEEKDEFIENV